MREPHPCYVKQYPKLYTKKNMVNDCGSRSETLNEVKVDKIRIIDKRT